MNEQRFESSDEIDLGKFFANFWSKRLVVVVFVVLGFAVGGVQGLFSQASSFTNTVATVHVKLNFKGAELGEYPNGSKYTPTDVIASKVLSRVYRANSLGDYGIELEEFVSAVNAYPWIPNQAALDAKYADLFSEKKLSALDRQKLDEQYQQETRNSNGRFLLLQWSGDSAAKVSKAVAHKVLADIPKQWASVSIQEYGVLDLEVVVPSKLDNYLLDTAEYIVVGDYLRDFARQLKVAALVLQQDAVVAVLKDEQTQSTVGDVGKLILNLENFHLSTLQRTFLIAPPPPRSSAESASLYLSSRQRELEEKIAEAERKSDVINRVYREYTDSAETQSASTQNAADKNGNLSPQIGDDFLTKLMRIGDELSDAKYKQDLLKERKELSFEAAELATEKQRIEAIISEMSQPRTMQIISNSEALDKSVSYVVSELSNYAQTLDRINLMARAAKLGKVGSLYEVIRAPQVTSSSVDALKAAVKSALFGLLGGLFLGIFVAFIRVLIQEARSPKSPSNHAVAV
jgi:hypothetical protein